MCALGAPTTKIRRESVESQKSAFGWCNVQINALTNINVQTNTNININTIRDQNESKCYNNNKNSL